MKITDEMIEKATLVMGNLFGRVEGQAERTLDEMRDEDEEAFGHCLASMRAALEAVAPLIVEECARVADGFDDDYSRSDEIAAAIRALAKEPAQAEGGK